MLQRLIDWQRTVILFLLAVGLSLVMAGTCLVPIAGWGAAYVFAVGLWMLAASTVPCISWLASAMVFRFRFGHWYFGA